MIKRLSIALCAMMAVAALVACSSQSASSTSSASTSSSTTTTSTSTSSSTSSSSSSTTDVAAASVNLGAVANTIAEDKDALKSTYPSKFTQETYTDAETGLSVTYNLFLPEGYDESASYPMVVFISDSSSVGDDPTASLTQGRGGLVWATEEWQAAYPTVVCVPTYPETILDDHSGYTTTEYVELTKRLIDTVASEHAVDPQRIFGTGQSMGCMTTLILASEYPELYAACMFVDGQWDISTLSGLEGQKFVYFAAEDDTNAWNGMQEVMSMFDADGVSYEYAQWDGTWTPDELSSAATELLAAKSDANFISWASGTIDASSGGMSAMGGSGSRGGGSGASGGSMPSGSSTTAEAESSSTTETSSSNAGSSSMGSVGYHMASFDYAYNCIAMMEWLIQQ